MANFPISHIIEFLGTVDPFNSLSPDEIDEVVSHMEIAFYPRNETIIRQGTPPPDHVFIIHTGSAKATTKDASGNQVLVDILEKGDIFGASSILEGKISLLTISSAEDLIVLQLPSSKFLKLYESHESFKRCFQFSIARYFYDMRYSLNDYQEQLLLLNTKNFADLIGKKVSDLMASNVITCLFETTIRDASKIMAEHNIGSIVVIDGNKHAIGIITDTDFRNRVIAKGISTDITVDEVMSSPVITINADEYAFDAIIKMSHYGIRHLVVYDNNFMVGILSERDFRIAMGSSPLGLIAEIERAQYIDDMIGLVRKIDRMLESLLRQGFPVESAIDLITELHDKVTLNLLRITENSMVKDGRGNHPVSYCWMALGSEGRREQTLRTDQDNALIYANVLDGREQEVRDWFIEFSDKMVNNLAKCGFPKCRGGIMASNPAWCQPYNRWMDIFSNWITSPDNLALRMVTIFFDFRAIFEDADFIHPLRQHVNEVIQSNRLFLTLLAKDAVENHPPVGFLGKLVFEKSGESKHKLDLKLRGIMPITKCARVIALDLGLDPTNTINRLYEIKERQVISETLYNDLKEAFHFMNYLRIAHHLNARAKNVELDNYIDLSDLNSLHRKMLKECFNVIIGLQKILERRYNTSAYKMLLS